MFDVPRDQSTLMIQNWSFPRSYCYLSRSSKATFKSHSSMLS